ERVRGVLEAGEVGHGPVGDAEAHQVEGGGGGGRVAGGGAVRRREGLVGEREQRAGQRHQVGRHHGGGGGLDLRLYDPDQAVGRQGEVGVGAGGREAQRAELVVEVGQAPFEVEERRREAGGAGERIEGHGFPLCRRLYVVVELSMGRA